MHPGVDVGAVVGAAALGNFVFVMGELQVGAAAVNVEMLAQVLAVHGRTFDVPAGTTRTPGGLPARLAGLGRFPQHEVERVALALLHFDPGAGLQLLQVLARQLAVFGEAVHGKQHVAAVGHIGMAVFNQLLHHIDDFGNVLGGLGLDIGAGNVQGVKIPVHVGGQSLGQRITAFAVFGRPLDDLVVDIGDVAHEGQVKAQITQIAGDHVKGDEGAAMTDMTQVVNGDTTDVHADLAGYQRDEFFFLSGQGIVDFQHESTSW